MLGLGMIRPGQWSYAGNWLLLLPCLEEAKIKESLVLQRNESEE